MQKQYRLFFTSVIFMVVFLSNSIYAQLLLVNTVPTDGAVNVDPDSTISITFSEAIDTTVNFDEFFLSIEMSPQNEAILDPTNINMNEDGKTLSLNNPNLNPKTKYTILLTGAVDVTGDSLNRPYVITFTTAAAMPPHKVDGQITFVGGSPLHSVVALIDVNSAEFDVSAAAVVLAEDGLFSIPYVEPGDYYMISIKDQNNDGIIDMEPGDAIGMYDNDENMIMNVITVTGDVEDLDIALSVFSLQTAGSYYDDAQVLATEWAADAEFVFTLGEGLNENGAAPLWMFIFYSAAMDSVNMIVNIGPAIVSMFTDEAGSGMISVPDGWIDSDAALTVAEANGGAAFRNDYPDYEISAFLGYSLEVFGSMDNDLDKSLTKSSSTSTSLLLSKKLKKLSFKNVLKLLNDDVDPYWFIDYYSDSEWEEQRFYVNAMDGSLFQGYTAREAVDATHFLYSSMETDAALVKINTFGVNESGKSNVWLQDYYSASTNMTHDFFTSGPLIYIRGSDIAETPIPALPLDWIDSDKVFHIADSAGAKDFRTEHADWEVYMELGSDVVDLLWGMGLLKNMNVQKSFNFTKLSKGQGVLNEAVSPSVWVVFVESQDDDELSYFMIDALTGDVYKPMTAQESVTYGFEVLQDMGNDFVFAGSISDQYNMETLDDFGSSWQNIFYSASKDSAFVVTVTAGCIATINGFPADPDQYTELSAGWIDSPNALQIAETLGGQAFRDQNEFFDIMCYMGADGESLFGLEYGSTPLWYFNYSSLYESIDIVFDAYTGDTLTYVEKNNISIPSRFRLSQNYPNPFNPSTEIRYEIPEKSIVTIRVLNLSGQEVNVLLNEVKSCGHYTISWNGTNQNQQHVGSGIYFIELQSESVRLVRKISLIR